MSCLRLSCVFFLLFILLLLLMTGTYSYNYVNSWMTEKKSTLTDIAQGMQKRIDAYRFFYRPDLQKPHQ
ncbi:hypothetical protein OS31_10680 [Dickeya oryzae]